jgi:predicted ATPase
VAWGLLRPRPCESSPMQNSNLYVLTGGPGAGKTTVLAELQRRGFPCLPEVARQIIQEQVQTGGTAVPWSDTARYAKRMLERSILSFRERTPASQITFCDRGIPDTLCYFRLIGHDDAEAVTASMTYRYAHEVFLAPPWQAIYATDSERKQSFGEAVRTCNLMTRVYEECGYEIVELPLVSPAERADFILGHVQRVVPSRLPISSSIPR